MSERSQELSAASEPRVERGLLVQPDIEFTASEDAGPGGPPTLSRAMGHESIQTTADFYEHLDTRDIRVDMELVEADA